MAGSVLLWPLAVVLSFTLGCLMIGVFYSRIHWLAKAALIITTTAMLGLFHYGFLASMGWAVAAKPPAEFQFLWADIREPVPDRDAGAIWIWLRPLVDQRPGEPRAVRLPYSRPLHEKIEQARQQGKEGQPVFMREQGQSPQATFGNNFYGGDEAGLVVDFIPPPSTAPAKNPT